MTSSAKQPLPEGGIREMIVIALPMVASQACDTVMIFTGRFFLSKIQPEFMNAAMGGGLTVFMMMSFFIGLIGYSTALVAQYLGAGRKKDCPRVITQALGICVLAYVPILLARPLAHALFEGMGIPAGQLGPQKLYFDILLYGTIITLFRHAFSCFFSGIGRTRVVMLASFMAMAVNALAGYLLIFGKCGLPALGIRGAAYAAILGALSGLLVVGAAYFRRQNLVEFGIPAAFRFDGNVGKRLVRFGFSPGLELFLNIVAFNIMVMTFHSHGLVTATAATVMLNWDMVSFVPLLGVEIAVTSMVGRFMGGGRPEVAHRSVMAALKVAMAYSAVIFVLFAGFPHFLVGFFRPEAAEGVFATARPLAVFMLQVASLYVLVDAFLVVFVGALRGAGDTVWAMGMTVGLHWAAAGALILCLNVFHCSTETAWVMVVSIFLAFSFLVFLRYRNGHWRSIRVVDDTPLPLPAEGFHDALDL